MDHAIWTLFDGVASELPDHEVLVWRNRRYPYSVVRDRALRLAAVLAEHGLGRHAPRSQLKPWKLGQDTVALYLLNGPEYLEASLGGYAAAAAPFNVNYRYIADELAYLLDDAAARAIVFHARFAPTLAEVLPRLAQTPRLLLQVADDSGHGLLDGALYYEAALAAAEPLATPDVSPDDAYVLYTGGTTGMPKGTIWRQGDIWVAALGGDSLGEPDVAGLVEIAVTNAKSRRWRFLPNAPFMHGGGHFVALRTLLTGGTVVVNDTVDHLDPEEAWQIVERERIDTIVMVGEAMARPLVSVLEKGERTYDTSSIFLVLVGAAATSPETKDRLLAQTPQAMIVDAAGASETGSGLVSISTKGSTADAGVFMGTPFAAVLDAGKTRLLSPGDDEIGWYAKRGRIPLGYLGDEAKTNATFPTVAGERWSVPGDRARWLEDGRIELLGRDSVTINTGGEKVFAEEVEAAMLTHPAVVDVIVVGRASERWGHEVVAVVSLNDDSVTDDQLVAAAAKKVARYKLPKAIVRVPTVVRAPNGKADYRWARDVAVPAGAQPDS